MKRSWKILLLNAIILVCFVVGRSGWWSIQRKNKQQPRNTAKDLVAHICAPDFEAAIPCSKRRLFVAWRHRPFIFDHFFFAKDIIIDRENTSLILVRRKATVITGISYCRTK